MIAKKDRHIMKTNETKAYKTNFNLDNDDFVILY